MGTFEVASEVFFVNVLDVKVGVGDWIITAIAMPSSQSSGCSA
jgi:hypothetical protein